MEFPSPECRQAFPECRGEGTIRLTCLRLGLRNPRCLTKRKALEAGAEALLTKPIDFAALRSEIDMRVESAA